ncbi:hypothetical protein HPB52_006430 [Rhipicephalus sanguineus]|uniref:ATP-dependent DNA helicase n=1 Tax=Rhipicephalus sanguineus TaxID=34632 RepID=A0A9D4Q547_RHISA|nr:hypothetical protein HPB52_006430 [Rhipicephalus sanguineus]
MHQLRDMCLQMCADDAHDTELHNEIDPRQARLVDQNDDEDLLEAPGLVAAKGRCAAVCTRQDVMTADDYREIMGLTNKEQFEVIREGIHCPTFPASDPLRIFLAGVARCGKTFVLRLIMDAYNRYTNTASTCTHNISCATTGKAAVAIGGLTVHAAFMLSMRTEGGLRDGDLDSFRSAFTNINRLPERRQVFHRLVIGDGRALEKEEVDMLQARFVSKDDAKLHCPHGVRLFYYNKESEAYNTQDAVQDVDSI